VGALAGKAPAAAQAPVDRGARRGTSDSEAPEEKGLAFSRLDVFVEQRRERGGARVGQDYQSDDPTYEMSFALAPRYYLWESESELAESLSLGARLELIREMTNSDTTTEEGEWTFSNLSVASQYSKALYDDDGYETTVAVRAPRLTFPTSKASANNGTILGVGGALLGIQDVPLFRRDSPVLRTNRLYPRSPATSTCSGKPRPPTNPEIERERMGPSGVTVPGDQLTGYAFTNHEVALGLTTNLAIHDRVHFLTLFELASPVEVPPPRGSDCRAPDRNRAGRFRGGPQYFGVIALFGALVSVSVVKELGHRGRLPEPHLADWPGRTTSQHVLQPRRALLRDARREPRSRSSAASPALGGPSTPQSRPLGGSL
jgi:hypothetical protein